MPNTNTDDLSRRERQIMSILYQKGQASAMEVLDALTNPPGYSTVRTLLRIMESKGHVKHIKRGARFVYMPVMARQSAAARAIRQVVNTFFGGSAEKAVMTLLSDDELRLSEDELEGLARLIDEAKDSEREAP